MKLHPLTILVRGGSRGLGFAVAGFVLGSAGGGALAAEGILPPIASASGIPLAFLFGAVGLGYEVIWHQRFEYDLTQDTLNIDSGVLFRREREIPFRRIQNVDIRRSLFQRLLQIARVNIETAGGGSTEASLQYVGVEEARRLQREIQRRKGRSAEETAAEDAEAPGAEQRAEPETELLFDLDDRDLILYSILSFDPRVLSVLFVIIPSVAPMMGADVDQLTASVFLALGFLGALVLAFGIWVFSAFARFVQFYGFKLRRVGDELRYERGLLQRYDGSIPLEKIQSVVVEENFLMRHFGFASLSIQTAGYAPGASPSGGSEAAVPLAKRGELFELARTIEPFEMPSFERPPETARRRYAIRYSLVVGALLAVAFGVDRFLVTVPWYLVAVLFVPIPYAARKKWAHRGWALLDGYAATRNGFWRRRIHVVPDFRVQTVIDSRTIFQRRWGLGTVIIDTASSRSLVSQDASAVDIEAETAERLRDAIADRLQAALGYAPADRD
jgi:putative membrane protein